MFLAVLHSVGSPGHRLPESLLWPHLSLAHSGRVLADPSLAEGGGEKDDFYDWRALSPHHLAQRDGNRGFHEVQLRWHPHADSLPVQRVLLHPLVPLDLRPLRIESNLSPDGHVFPL